MNTTDLRKGDKVVVMDQGLISLYNMMKSFDPTTKPNNQGWVNEILEDGYVMVEFPIGDEDPKEHSQVAPYPINLVIKKEW